MTIHDETDALTVRAGRRVTPDSAQPTALDVRERGLRLAGTAAVVGAVAELAHGIQDIHRGLLRSNALTGYVAVALPVVAGIGLGGAAVRGHRRAAVPLVVVGLLWTVGAVADHPGALTNPGQLIGRAWRLVPIGLVLTGWGVAVVLVRHGPLPSGREAPAFLVGAGVGVLAAQVVARRHRLTLTGATITLIIGGLSFYAAYDIDALGRWPVWAVSLAAWGTYEAFHSRRQVRVVTDG